MSFDSEATAARARIVDAVRACHGVRLWSPVPTRVLPWDTGPLAVELTEDVLCIRLVATRLPLPPVLNAVQSAVRQAVAQTRWREVRLRLDVTGIAAEAFDPP